MFHYCNKTCYKSHKQAMIELKRFKFGIMNIEDQPTHIHSKQKNPMRCNLASLHIIYIHYPISQIAPKMSQFYAKNNHSFFKVERYSCAVFICFLVPQPACITIIVKFHHPQNIMRTLNKYQLCTFDQDMCC